MPFDVTLDSRGGRPNPDNTANRWDSEFIRTVNGKAKGGFTLSRYKDIISKNRKWGSGVIRYRDPWVGNLPAWVQFKRNENNKVYYDINIDQWNWSGTAKVWYGLGVVKDLPIESRRDYVHRIMNCGDHPDNHMHYAMYVRANGWSSTLVATPVYGGAIENAVILGGGFESGDLVISTLFPEWFFKYTFSDGTFGYVQTFNGRATISVPPNLKGDRNAWITIDPNGRYQNSNEQKFGASQKFPFNWDYPNGSGFLSSAGELLSFGITSNSFNNVHNWFVSKVYHQRSGNNVTITIKYIL